MAALRAQVLNDPVCRAHVRSGQQVVVGVGSVDAKIRFVGEAPRSEDEVQGEPLTGIVLMIELTGHCDYMLLLPITVSRRMELPRP